MLAEGLTLPDGPITVLRPRAGERFGPLDLGALADGAGVSARP